MSSPELPQDFLKEINGDINGVSSDSIINRVGLD